MGPSARLPQRWEDRGLVGSTPRKLPTPSTSSSLTSKPWKDFQGTPPPALLHPVHLQFHGSGRDTSRLADEVASQSTMEEDRADGATGAGQVVKKAGEEVAEGSHQPEGAIEEEEEAEETAAESLQGGAGFLPTPVEVHCLTQRVTKTARRRKLQLTASKAQLRDELAHHRKRGLRSAGKARREEKEDGSQEERG
jgi:hypothetical protein